MSPVTAWGRISGERFKQGQQNVTRLVGTISLTNMLLPVGCKTQLNSAQKCVKRVRRQSQIIWLSFNVEVESPNFASTSMLTLSTATSGGHLFQFEK